MPAATWICSEDVHASVAFFHCQVLSPCVLSTVIPAPSTAASFPAPLAISMFLSVTVRVVEFTVVVVPSTCKSPFITTVPVLSPIAAGSIVMVDGPVTESKWPVVAVIIPVTVTPAPVVFIFSLP